MGLFVSSHTKKLQKLWKLCGEMGGRINVLLIRPKELPSEETIMSSLKMCLDGSIRQAQESQHLIETTVNPRVFYERLDFLRQRLTYLSDVEQVDKKLIAGHPTKILKKLPAESIKLEADMWERYFIACDVKSQDKKTDKARRKVFDAYFADAASYNSRLGEKARAVIERKRVRVAEIFGD